MLKYLIRINKIYNNLFNKKKIIYIDMDDTIVKFKEAWNKHKEDFPDIKYPQSMKGFFFSLEPIEDSIETINWLIEQDKFEVFFLTAPSIKNRECYSEKRDTIEKFFGEEMLNNLIISPRKDLNKGDFLIDDCNKGKGQDKFKGKLIHFGTDQFPNWKIIKDFFKDNYV